MIERVPISLDVSEQALTISLIAKMLSFASNRHQCRAAIWRQLFSRQGQSDVMHFSAAVLLWGAVMIGGAQASSLIVLEPMKTPLGPSIVVLGAPSPSVAVLPEAGDSSAAKSPSIIALGEAVPAVSYEKLAAIGTEPTTKQNRPAAVPMIIRGGIVGDAFSRSEPTPVAIPQPEQVATTAPDGGAENAQPASSAPAEPAAAPPAAPHPPGSVIEQQ